MDVYSCIDYIFAQIEKCKKWSDFSKYWILEYLQISNNKLLDQSKCSMVNMLLYIFFKLWSYYLAIYKYKVVPSYTVAASK